MIVSPMDIALPPHVTSRRNKSGNVRYYFRRRGYPTVRLPFPLSPEFANAYALCLDAGTDRRTINEGSFGWLCDQYLDTADFSSKAQSTQNARRRIIQSMVRELIDPNFDETFGQEKAICIGRAHIEVLRDRKASKPNAANERLKILAQIFKMAISRGFVQDNPLNGVDRLKTPRGGHQTATDEQIAQYLEHHTNGSPWLAMMILKNTGIRVSDLRILGRQHVRGGVLVFDTVKTGVRCELPVTAELVSALPDQKDTTHLTFLLNEHGAPYSSDKSLSQRISKWFRQADIQGITAHSVRKWLATRMATNEATEYQLMAWFGWRDPKEARPYVQSANRRNMASKALSKIANV